MTDEQRPACPTQTGRQEPDSVATTPLRFATSQRSQDTRVVEGGLPLMVAAILDWQPGTVLDRVWVFCAFCGAVHHHQLPTSRDNRPHGPRPAPCGPDRWYLPMWPPAVRPAVELDQ